MARVRNTGRSQVRAQGCLAALHASTAQQGRGSSRTRGNRRLVITEVPEPILDANMVPIGVRVHVQLFVNGQEVPVDPVREFINPPLAVVASRSENAPPVLTQDPLRAMWDILWDQVEAAPNPDGWRAP